MMLLRTLGLTLLVAARALPAPARALVSSKPAINGALIWILRDLGVKPAGRQVIRSPSRR
jgi:hypothetical protein